MARTFRVHHKNHGLGTMLDVRAGGRSVLVKFDDEAWPHFDKPKWCDIANVEKIDVKQIVTVQGFSTEGIGAEEKAEAWKEAVVATSHLDPKTIDELQEALDTRTSTFIEACRARGATVELTGTWEEEVDGIEWENVVDFDEKAPAA